MCTKSPARKWQKQKNPGFLIPLVIGLLWGFSEATFVTSKNSVWRIASLQWMLASFTIPIIFIIKDLTAQWGVWTLPSKPVFPKLQTTVSCFPHFATSAQLGCFQLQVAENKTMKRYIGSSIWIFLSYSLNRALSLFLCLSLGSTLLMGHLQPEDSYHVERGGWLHLSLQSPPFTHKTVQGEWKACFLQPLRKIPVLHSCASLDHLRSCAHTWTNHCARGGDTTNRLRPLRIFS